MLDPPYTQICRGHRDQTRHHPRISTNTCDGIFPAPNASTSFPERHTAKTSTTRNRYWVLVGIALQRLCDNRDCVSDMLQGIESFDDTVNWNPVKCPERCRGCQLEQEVKEGHQPKAVTCFPNIATLGGIQWLSNNQWTLSKWTANQKKEIGCTGSESTTTNASTCRTDLMIKSPNFSKFYYLL